MPRAPKIIETGRAGEAIDAPPRSVCVRKFARFLLDFNKQQLKICWQMAGLVDKPEIEAQGQRDHIRELERAAREQEDPVEGHLLAHNFLALNLEEIPDDDQADVEALDSPVVADQVEEQLSLLPDDELRAQENDSDLPVVSGGDIFDNEDEDDPLFGPLLPQTRDAKSPAITPPMGGVKIFQKKYGWRWGGVILGL